MALAGDRDSDEFCDDPFDDDEDDDDGEGEEFYDDDGDAEEFCGDPCDDDDDSEAELLCGNPCDDEDEDDGEGEESCDDPSEDDEDEEFRDDDDDDDDDDDVEGEELCDDEEAGEGEGEDLCHEPSGEEGKVEGKEVCSGPCEQGGSGGGGGGGEGFCVSGFSNPDGSDLSDSLEDRSASEAEEEAPGLNVGGEGLMPPPPAVGAFRMLVSADDTDIDSDSYSDDDDSSTYSDVGEVEPGTLPASRAAVDGLPEASLSEEEALCGCAVCKDVFASGQRVVWLPCKHYFHGDCIQPWLAIRSTCPVCRYQLPTDDAEFGQQQARQMMVLVPVAHQGARRRVEVAAEAKATASKVCLDAAVVEYSSDDDITNQRVECTSIRQLITSVNCV